MKQTQLTETYRAAYNAWLEAFQIKTGEDISKPEKREKIISLLKSAHKNEIQAVEIMSGLLFILGYDLIRNLKNFVQSN